MSEVPIPDGLIGRSGMVAMLQRVSPSSNGRLVVIRHAVGPMPALSASAKPVFAWQALVLGEPIDVHGKPSREIVVADPCLKPVSQITTEQVEKLVRARALKGFEAAMADLQRILEKNPVTEDELDAAVSDAGEIFGISYALEVVPTATALRNMGFTPSPRDSEANALSWSGRYMGQELYVFAGPDMFGRWTITGTRTAQRNLMWAEQVVLGNEPRGKLALLVVDLWRQAFGRAAPVPSNLEVGLRYEQHLQDVRSLEIGLPRLYLDGDVFRATRKWLAQRHPRSSRDDLDLANQPLNLAFADGLLRLQSGSELFACPGRGVWVEDCEISLGAFIDTPPSHLRGRFIILERQLETLSINGYSLALVSTDAEAS